ncbi:MULTISPECIES: hypothetical protein [Bradyrhizobium]|jgi:hypothetical protein|uniref:hypothetical protein n=1 Tax=Bradyrhizobium TaxID=374 RepID=UPI001E39947C|nr:hypothetical protein [Bradyrhizobium japonicum]MCD9112700.1 hypothetical protein [Bradyrhizobium japonicum]MCD9259815.1 hypothetical protein [Bradyrhizobium japonicum SEMIA 5079]MCD9825005.1 hypothetical protein [Bradyrhizobium japonicum]MCD9897856.1 hypothetical protein [Bradyrhizobium japonicum]MCD9913056.1 hypothetical protein [Bradyrhizobium japonicum]
MNEDIVAVSARRDAQAVKVHVRGGANTGANWTEGISTVRLGSEVIAESNPQDVADAGS